jgi:hypothetical protein
MKLAGDPQGVFNDHYLREATFYANTVLVGWGNDGEFKARADRVLRQLKRDSVKPVCLGINKNGSPVHPLFQKDNSTFIEYPI